MSKPVVDEKLKEFVEKYSFHCGVGCEISSRDVEQFAQAVADFTEKRVLEELWKDLPVCKHCDSLELIHQHLAALEKKGEKDE